MAWFILGCLLFIVFSDLSVFLNVKNILHFDTDYYKYGIPYQGVVGPLKISVEGDRLQWPRRGRRERTLQRCG